MDGASDRSGIEGAIHGSSDGPESNRSSDEWGKRFDQIAIGGAMDCERAMNGASDGSGSNRKSDGLCER